MSETVRLGRHTVEISHPDKVYFPDDGLTKAGLVGYYRRIADVMLPYLRDRPTTLHRFPDGIDGDGFFQQQRPDFLPDWVAGAELPKREGGSFTHTVIDSAAALVAIVNTGCITPHLWLSRTDEPELPDQMIFDLDPPPGGSFGEVRFAARRLRRLLDELELPSLVKTTGSTGLHVVVPLRAEADFDQVRAFARRAAELLAKRHPERLTLEQSKRARRGRLFLDTLRNAYGQHAVAPYAVRALPGAPVATPLDWSELGGSDMGPRRYTVGNLFRRLGQRDDPWSGAWRSAVTLEGAFERLEALEDGGG